MSYFEISRIQRVVGEVWELLSLAEINGQIQFELIAAVEKGDIDKLICALTVMVQDYKK